MYTDSFSRIASWLLASGLNSKWMLDGIDYLQINGIRWVKSKENIRKNLENMLRIFMDPNVQAFELKHFAVAFGILIVGLSLAGIGFCLEMLWEIGVNTPTISKRILLSEHLRAIRKSSRYNNLTVIESYTVKSPGVALALYKTLMGVVTQLTVRT
ncbi:unnamed protein product [Allacma fusca]|uniref:Uncharacterized protein n=1 Tax=Allacma fusca TaxID=39272 RepID=A0A8J2K908_9HEXA|nr:unnamed protein product [Allacma fusca]